MDTICSYLACDHKRCIDLFTQVETSAALKEWMQVEEKLMPFVNAFDRHMRMEESVLLPAFEKAIRNSRPQIDMLRLEHQHIRTIIERVSEAVHRHDAIDFAFHTETLALLMQQHNLKEEDMLYPLLDRIMADYRAEIINAMREQIG